jgi:hypothetical protein
MQVTIEPDAASKSKNLNRKILSNLFDTYGKEFLNGKRFAYDGEKSLFTVCPLTFNSHKFSVHLDDDPNRGRFVYVCYYMAFISSKISYQVQNFCLLITS